MEPSQLVATANAVPASKKLFDLPDRDAGLYGITPGLLATLVELGLRFRESHGEGRLFARSDLHYIALRLGVFSVHLRTMRQWVRTLEEVSAGDASWFAIKYVPQARLGTETRSTVLLPFNRLVEVDHPPPRSADRNIAGVRWAANAEWPEAPGPLKALLAEAATIDFYQLPPALISDIEFISHARLGDCGAVTNYILARARQVGLEARAKYGLLISVPLSAVHIWPEFVIDGMWVPFDPSLLNAMRAFAHLDPDRWPPWRSPGGVLLGLSDRDIPVVQSGGRPRLVSFPTTRGSAGKRAAGP